MGGFTPDLGRTTRLASYRLLCFAPMYSLWMRWMERRFPAVTPSAVVTKIALDQLVWTPPSIAFFYTYLTVLEGGAGGREGGAAAGGEGGRNAATHEMASCEEDAVGSCFRGRVLEGVKRAQLMLWPTLQINWPFWCTVHLATFTVVPLQHRLVFISTVQVAWNAFLSGMNEAARRDDD